MPTTPTPTTGAIVLRVSSQRQATDDKASYDVQRDACLAYAASRGITVPPDLIWQEVGQRDQYYTRNGLQAALTAAEQGRYQALIVYRLDRLTDDIGNFLRILDRLKAHGALPWSATEPDIDLSTPNGLWYVHTKLHFTVQPERVTTATRTQAARRKYIEQGRPWASHRPRYGYQWVADMSRVRMVGGVAVPLKERLEPDPATAPVVVQIYAWVDEGKTLRWIARALSGLEDGGAHQHPTPRQYQGLSGANEAGHWNEATVAKLLDFPGYMGRWPAYRTKREPRNDGSEQARARAVPRDEWFWVEPSPAPALVDPALWQRVQTRLANNKLYSARNRQHPAGPEQGLLFGGMARCGLCGGPMSVIARPASLPRPDGSRAYRYTCSRSHHNFARCQGIHRLTHGLDEAVWQALLGVLRAPDTLAKLAARSEAQDRAARGEDGVALVTPIDELATLEAHLASKENDLRALTLRSAAVPVGDPASVGYDLAISALGAEVTMLRAECGRARHKVQRYERVEQAVGEWRDYLAMWDDNARYMAWPKFKPAHRRQWLEALGARVIVHPGDTDGPIATLQLKLSLLDLGSVPRPQEEGEVDVFVAPAPLPPMPSMRTLPPGGGPPIVTLELPDTLGLSDTTAVIPESRNTWASVDLRSLA